MSGAFWQYPFAGDGDENTVRHVGARGGSGGRPSDRRTGPRGGVCAEGADLARGLHLSGIRRPAASQGAGVPKRSELVALQETLYTSRN